jgi:CheY-like chemotaxis protein
MVDKGKTKKIMIVDDDPFCLMLVKGMLEGLGQAVDTAEDGK